jgi:hypothetical protein
MRSPNKSEIESGGLADEIYYKKIEEKVDSLYRRTGLHRKNTAVFLNKAT